jgi:formate dehydrogenase maturation protein FdhE
MRVVEFEARYEVRVTCERCGTTAALVLESLPYDPRVEAEIQCPMCRGLMRIPPIMEPDSPVGSS